MQSSAPRIVAPVVTGSATSCPGLAHGRILLSCPQRRPTRLLQSPPAMLSWPWVYYVTDRSTAGRLPTFGVEAKSPPEAIDASTPGKYRGACQVYN
jgi:hypothetical protein